MPNLKLPKLEGLDFSANQLTGSIPAFETLTSLRELSLFSNQLTSEIPALKSPNLNRVYLSDNQLSGPIPAFVGKLEHFYADRNQFNFSSLES
ncbi:leucine-rich repeat domain-containing protein [Niabella ginsengisoli]|uniref:Leucine-rich repeat domain-containing protein n=1 Tax=Niabella ginsengisoli TaxID=522298 RepID=A0ABS9SHX8_9BACT|nr:leucine-rich repeat domain-containing protein [Niabella ginsengisoli]